MLLDLAPVVLPGTGGGDTYTKTGTASVIPAASGTWFRDKRIPRIVVPPSERIVIKTGLASLYPAASGSADRALLTRLRQINDDDELLLAGVF